MHILTSNEIKELFLSKINKCFYHVIFNVFGDFDYNIVIYRKYLVQDRNGNVIHLDTAYWTNNNKVVLNSQKCDEEEMFIILRKVIEKKY